MAEPRIDPQRFDRLDAATRTVLSETALFAESVTLVEEDVADVQRTMNGLSADLNLQRQTLESMREEITRPPDDGYRGLADKLETIAAEQTRLRAQLEASEARQSDRFAQLGMAITTLTEQVGKNRDALAAVERKLGSLTTVRSARSYLLRERAENPLPDLGLSVVLGRLTGDTLASVEFSDTGGPIETGRKGAVRIGEPFCVTDHTGRVFRATFGYVQTRLLIRDFIGLEMAMLHAACE